MKPRFEVVILVPLLLAIPVIMRLSPRPAEAPPPTPPEMRAPPKPTPAAVDKPTRTRMNYAGSVPPLRVEGLGWGKLPDSGWGRLKGSDGASGVYVFVKGNVVRRIEAPLSLMNAEVKEDDLSASIMMRYGAPSSQADYLDTRCNKWRPAISYAVESRRGDPGQKHAVVFWLRNGKSDGTVLLDSDYDE